MKKLLFLSLAVLTALTTSANPVHPDRAMQVAKNYLAQYVKGAERYSATMVYTHTLPKSGEPAMYVVNVGNMFILVAADDVAHPVLGYSLSRPWPTAGKGKEVILPSQVNGYLDDLAGQIAAAVEASIAPDWETAAEWQQLLTTNLLPLTTNAPDSVGPLLTTTWNQAPYYNALCPEDSNGLAYTGCVATAMAQIIKYWGYPVHGRGTHSYNTDAFPLDYSSHYGTLSVNYDSANYDYAQMPAALTATSTAEEVNAVATLMRDCGVSINMGYSAEGSAATDYDARAALINFFRYSPNLSYAEKSNFTQAVWDSLLRENIRGGMPLLYGGDGNAGGHAFVCDGYNTDNYFHFNFGWGGIGDGWYLTNAVNPEGVGFNSFQDALFGIVPDTTGNVIIGQTNGTSTFRVDEPMEFYHLLGHNAYDAHDWIDYCNNTVLFSSADTTKQLVLDIISFEAQNVTVYDGEGGSELTHLHGRFRNDLSPVVSTTHSLNLQYQGDLNNTGFHLSISQEDSCRMVSNVVTTVDTTMVHMAWRENGSATQWEVEYGTTGFAIGEGTLVLTNDTSVSINGLTKHTTYDFYIRPVCGSRWFGPVSILTDFDTVTLAVNNDLLGSVALVGALPEGATVLVDGSYRVPRGSEMTVRAVFDSADFHFLYWTRSTDTVSTDTIYADTLYTFRVTGSVSYTAHIEYLPCPYVYVSKTGFVLWEKPHTSPVAYAKVDVKSDTGDTWTTVGYIASKNYIQVPTWLLTDSTLYNVSIILFNNSPFYEAPAVTLDWFYVACDHFEGVDDFTGEVTDQGVALHWTATGAPQRFLLYRDNVLIDTLTTTSYLDTTGAYNSHYTLRRLYGGQAECPYNNDSLSTSCEQSPTLYVDLTLAAAPATFGTAEYVLPDTTGHFAVGDSCTVRAIANESYSFTHWTLNGETVSSDNPYTFTVGQGGELTANFEYAPVADLYVSRTGWATWDNPHSQPGDVSCSGMQVSVKGLDGQLLSTQSPSPTADHLQLTTDNLTDSTLYLMSVTLTDTAGSSSESTTKWYYVACEHLSGFDTVSGVFGQQGVALNWSYPPAITPSTDPLDWGSFHGFVTDSGAIENEDVEGVYNDASWIVGAQSLGYNCNHKSNFWVGEKITLSEATRISEMEFYAYRSGFAVSTFDGLYAMIYQGNPEDSVVAWGNAESNLMTSTAFTGCYRGSANMSPVYMTARPIMSVTASGLDIELAPGTYYLVWSLSSYASGAPYAVPHAEPGVGNTGCDGIQYSNSQGWHSLYDNETGAPMGLSYRLVGERVPAPEPVAAAIFRDGELLDTTSSDTYTDIHGSAASNYELRVVYGGNRQCPFGNTMLSMACPQPVTLHCGVILSSDTTATACDSFTWIDGVTYTESTQTPTFTISNALGCDSIVMLHLTINYSAETTVTDTAEGSYTWHETTYTQSGTYQWQGSTLEGCDSTVTLQLVITQVGIAPVDDISVTVYPNPTTGWTTIDANDVLSVEVFDQAGRHIATHDNTNCIHIGGLASGIYLYKIHLPRGISVQRVILTSEK